MRRNIPYGSLLEVWLHRPKLLPCTAGYECHGDRKQGNPTNKFLWLLYRNFKQGITFGICSLVAVLKHPTESGQNQSHLLKFSHIVSCWPEAAVNDAISLNFKSMISFWFLNYATIGIHWWVIQPNIVQHLGSLTGHILKLLIPLGHPIIWVIN